ncbi:MAG TPA: hypothetical protein VHJ58_06755 [Vicinamibacterales bacterium]|jgi:hypothetical protein|nr:hypothetical protein [Vicinamibacterales bacterium]
MRLGRPVAPIVLTTEERDTLERWARRPTTAQALALRARLVLRCAAGETATAIALDVHVTKQTVGNGAVDFWIADSMACSTSRVRACRARSLMPMWSVS